MYHAIVRRRMRHGFGLLTAGEIEPLVGQFATGSLLHFPGDHRMGGEYRGRTAIRGWFAELRRSFPDFAIVPRQILVRGWPWHTQVATWFSVRATFPDGTAYENEGVQLLELRWGRVHADRLFEDTQRVAAALERVDAGRASAGLTDRRGR